MGEVYRATDTKLGRDVALKLLPSEMAASPERLERFQREAKALAALDHPGIVTVHSVEEADGVHFLTMQLVEGQPLDQVLPEGGLSIPQILEIATGLADALAAAHEKGIVHRDLKPANVMVTKEGRVKVLDFGLAKITGAELAASADSEMPTDVQTREGVVMGTVPYMSPEQVSGLKIDHRTDIFSLGILLYEMATGRRPFQGRSSAELASAILRDAPPALEESRTDIPDGLRGVIARCLQKEPGDRFPTVREAAEALRDLRGGPSPITPTPTRVRAVTSSTTASTGARREQEGFWVAVLPFKHRGSDAGVEALAEGLTEDIVTGLSRFSHLRVIARSSTSHYSGEGLDVRSVGQELGARYVMDGSVRQAGSTLRVAVQLVDASTGAHLWAETYNRPFDAAAIFELQDDLVPRIVSTVADWYGILSHSMSEAVRSKPIDQLSPYEALLRAFGYYERVTPEEHATARPILERAVEDAPGDAAAWAMLSMLYGEEHRFEFNALPDPLGRSLQAARRAVEAAPGSNVSHLALAQAHFFRKEFEAFRSAAERAVALNPLDGATVEYLGHLLAFAGDWERGCELGGRARQLNPNHAAWYWALPLLDAFRRGDYRGARALVPKAYMPGQYYSHALWAAVYGQLGDREAAGEELQKVLALRPDFAAIARDQFGRWYLPELVERLIEGLRKAGLEIPPAEGTAPGASDDVGRPAAEPSVGPARDPAAVSIAVLPFSDTSPGQDQDWFAAGTHEALLTALQQIGGLRVTSRTSSMRYRGTTAPMPEIAVELRVRWLVEGSVGRFGDRMRVTAALVDGAEDRQVWSGPFERDVEDILAMQSEIARVIAGEIHVALTPDDTDRLARAPRVDPAVYRAYVLGLHHFDRVTPDGFRRCVERFDDALALDPDFAPAHAARVVAHGIAVEYGWLSRAEARPIVERSLEAVQRLSPGSGEALHAQADFQFHIDRDFEAAEQSFRKAAEKTSNAYVLFGLGWLLSQMGRHDEAVAALETAVDLDPRSPLVRADLGWWLFGARQYARAVEEARLAVDLDPSFPEAHWLLAATHAQEARFEEALREFERYESLYGKPVPWFRGYLNALAGRRDQARRDLAELERRVEAGEAPGIERAQIHLGLGDRERVLEILEKADAPGVSFQPYLWPEYETYHSEPRFRAALIRFSLPLPPTESDR